MKKLIRAKEICEMFGISRATVDNWSRYGYLTRQKVGRNIFYSLAEVERLSYGRD